MYCNECGKHNPEDSKFCQSCGAKIVKVSEHKTDNHTHIESSSSVTENKNTTHDNKKVKAGLEGWLALIGLGLIVSPFITGYNLYGYFPLFNQTYNIPGYMTLLQFEFVISSGILLLNLYVLYLYFKRKRNFPRYYIIYLIGTAIFVSLDHLLLASLAAPTPEQQ